MRGPRSPERALCCMPFRYAKNRATYVLEALRRPWAARHSPQWWLPPESAASACEHPSLSGLWFLRDVVCPEAVADIRSLVAHSLPKVQSSGGPHTALYAAEREVTTLRERLEAMDVIDIHLAEQLAAARAGRDAFRAEAEAAGPPVPPVRTATHWDWYEFEPGRLLAPVLVYEASASTAAQRGLEEFEVFDCSHPREWLSLRKLLNSETEEVARGARALRRVIDSIVEKLPGALSPRAGCDFLQLQVLERGASVTPHIDAPSPPADVVATLTLSGNSSIIVGGVAVELRVGDVYAIAGAARWDVPHEVRPSFSDRLTLTIRYSDLPAVSEAEDRLGTGASGRA